MKNTGIMGRRFTSCIIAAILLAFSCHPSFGKAPDLRAGLSNLHVYSIVQDSLGYVWIATANGLCRHLGNSYEVFSYSPTDAYSLPSNNIGGLFYHKNKLWIATGRGVASKTPESSRFTRYRIDKGSCDGFFLGFVCFNDRILAYGFNGIYEVDEARHSLKARFPLAMTSVDAAASNGNDALWVGSGPYLYRLNSGFHEKLKMKSPSGDMIHSIFPVGKDLLVGTSNGLFKFNTSDNSFRRLGEGTPLAFACINMIANSCSGDLVSISTLGEGQYFLNTTDDSISPEWQNYSFEPIPTRDFTSSFFDRDRNLWVGTFDKGIFLVPENPSPFNPDFSLAKEFEGRFVTRVSEDSFNRLWVGTRYDGLFIYDPRTASANKLALIDSKPKCKKLRSE